MTLPQRIVSLLPSSTEILCALGLETSLVGLSHVCDYPSTDALCRPGAPALVVEWDRLQAYAPEVLLLSPCGPSLAQIRAALPAFPGNPCCPAPS
jgi:ABC-type Fe3+-hydroxamate transport system substrate-binding protein